MMMMMITMMMMMMISNIENVIRMIDDVYENAQLPNPEKNHLPIYGNLLA